MWTSGKLKGTVPMLITEVLARNAQFYGDEICLVEVNPALEQKREVTWREYELMETNAIEHSRREMTWRQFDDAANRFANLLLSRGLGKGSKVAILLMNCLEWLPIYFGILKTGAVAIPMNYRYTSEEIEYCLKLAEADALVGPPTRASGSTGAAPRRSGAGASNARAVVKRDTPANQSSGRVVSGRAPPRSR